MEGDCSYGIEMGLFYIKFFSAHLEKPWTLKNGEWNWNFFLKFQLNLKFPKFWTLAKSKNWNFYYFSQTRCIQEGGNQLLPIWTLYGIDCLFFALQLLLLAKKSGIKTSSEGNNIFNLEFHLLKNFWMWTKLRVANSTPV